MASERWYSMPIADVFNSVESSNEGLHSREAEARIKKYGLNILKRKAATGPLTIFINQFKSLLVALLIVAVVISAVIGSIIDAVVIGVIVVVNAVLGFTQEYKAERAMAALRKLASPTARVIRDGKEIEVPSREVVPGDIILLEQGAKIPADARLIEALNLDVDESILTGESNPVSKVISILKAAKLSLGDQKNMLFRDTIVTRGRGKAVVVATGMDSEVGNVAKLLQSVKKEDTPLQKKLASIARSLGVAIVIIAAIVFLLGILRGGAIFEMLITSIALAVAAVPEGLPAVVTITLAIGLKRMAKFKAYIRKLPVVETLGNATVICSDKTGTLTKNEMTVQQIYTNHELLSVSGSGYDVEGNFTLKTKKIDPIKNKNIELLLRAGALCTTASITKKDSKTIIIGDPTEGALLVAAAKASITKEVLLQDYKNVGELPFDPSRKMMTVIYKDAKGKRLAFVKGAPEEVLKKCNSIYIDGKIRRLTDKDKKQILDANKKMAQGALRNLGVAYRILTGEHKISVGTIEKSLVFIGIEGMIDPPREEVKEALAQAKSAGIISIMITGDHALTAEAIANQLGMLSKGDKIVTGEELEKMKQDDLAKEVEHIRVFARVDPAHKVRIIQALKSRGHVVAMTGDGINDAPALKQADIGVAMGIKGTDVAKEASDMILGDDNFATIISAVREGRSIYDNIIKFVRYLLSSNMGEVLTIFAAILIGLPLPLIAVQILWMNLLTDGLPALALGLDPPDRDVMKRMPRKTGEKVIGTSMWIFSAVVGVVMMIGTLALFKMYLPFGENYARTMAFSVIVIFQLFNVFNSRTDRSLLKGDLFNNKYLMLAITSSIMLQVAVVYFAPLQQMFSTISLVAIDWVWILVVSFMIIPVIEIKKAISHKSAAF